jgi:hypothetical protein
VKPLALAKHYCANYLADGSCIGTDFKPNGDQFRFLPEGSRCLIACGQRCKYFEASVLPMDADSWEWTNPIEGKQFKQVANQYRRKHSASGSGLATKQRRCPDCKTLIGPRKRYCSICAAKRQARSNRNRK